MAKFWLRMAALFGHTWASQYGDSPEGDAADTWAAALAGVAGPQIAHGLREVLKLGSDFPPSAPRFRALCLGVPSLAEVKIDMRNASDCRRPFTRLLWQYLDSYTFTRSDTGHAERMLRDAYDLAMAHVMSGGALPEASTAIAFDPDAERALYDRQHADRMRELAA